MTAHLSPLESLPNELLADVFQFLHPFHLFRAFYHLNSRLNVVLETLPSLTLSLPAELDADGNALPFIRSLAINRAVDVDLRPFLRVQTLVLRYPTEKLIAQLDLLDLPHLEHLYLNHMHSSVSNRISHLCRKIFSGAFPRLRCCHLFEWGTLSTNADWTLSPSLRTLKVGRINLHAYEAILSACPNLHFLQLATVTSSRTPARLVPHGKLRRMVIRTTPLIEPWKKSDIDNCLAFVPNLEHLDVHRTYQTGKRKTDWLASILSSRLAFLQQFDFYLHVCDAILIGEAETFVDIEAMREAFQLAHHRHLYRSQLIINHTLLF